METIKDFDKVLEIGNILNKYNKIVILRGNIHYI